AHQAGEEGGGELRVAGNGRGAAAGEAALELVAGVDGERRIVAEVEALELIVTEDHDDVGPRRHQPPLQRCEGRGDARGLRTIRLDVVEGNVGAKRARGAHVVP